MPTIILSSLNLTCIPLLLALTVQPPPLWCALQKNEFRFYLAKSETLLVLASSDSYIFISG